MTESAVSTPELHQWISLHPINNSTHIRTPGINPDVRRQAVWSSFDGVNGICLSFSFCFRYVRLTSWHSEFLYVYVKVRLDPADCSWESFHNNLCQYWPDHKWLCRWCMLRDCRRIDPMIGIMAMPNYVSVQDTLSKNLFSPGEFHSSSHLLFPNTTTPKFRVKELELDISGAVWFGW